MAEHDEAVKLVTKLVCRLRRVSAEHVNPDSDLVDTLGFDSLDAAELVAAIHQETGHELSVDSYEDLRTIESVARRMSERSAV